MYIIMLLCMDIHHCKNVMHIIMCEIFLGAYLVVFVCKLIHYIIHVPMRDLTRAITILLDFKLIPPIPIASFKKQLCRKF